MKKISFLVVFILMLATIMSGCGNTISPSNTMYCRNCGKQISSDSNYCIYCGVSLTEKIESSSATASEYVADTETDKPQNEVRVEPLPRKAEFVQNQEITQQQEKVNRTVATNVSRNDRDWQHYFCGSKLNYNVFETGEVKNCYAFHMEYSSKIRNPECGKTATGTRIVYVRDKLNEEADNDSAWIEVGRFSYESTSGETISVDINWDNTLGPLNVYSMAAVMDKNMSGASFSADWGNFVTLYSYE